MSRKNVLIIIGVVLVAAAVVGANLYFKKDKGLTVNTEVVKARDLESIVAASGKIQPKRLVQISADTPGRVVNLAVNEGDRIKKGQLLLQIDPKSLRTRVDSNTGVARRGAGLARRGAGVDGAEPQAIETRECQLEQARQVLTRQQDLWRQQLTTREALERAENDVKAAQSALQEREKQLTAQQSQVSAQSSRIQQERAVLESARYDLSKNTISSPIDGIVTRRNIQEGETAVIGTMNNAGTVLLTLADMSVIQAEVEVDETNIPSVQLGQPAKITIDALPDKTFKGHVSEIGNSPILAAGAAQSATNQATNFKVVVILDEPVPGRASWLHLHRRHHDGDAQGGDVGADSGGGRPRAGVRRERTDRQGTEDGQEEAIHARAGGVGGRAQAGANAQGNGRRIRRPRQQGRVHPDQDGDRRREVFRSAVGPEGRRSGRHRAVQFGARDGRRRSGEDR
jgi:HlyD family secretion protein